MYSTARIATSYSGNVAGSGTGFFFDFDAKGGRRLPVLITNNHVVKGATTGTITVHLADATGLQPNGETLSLTFSDFESRWIRHPNAEIDMCAMPIGPVIQEIENRRQKVYAIYLDSSLVRTDTQLQELDAVCDVLMVGYPNGLWDETHNFPLLRRGITATHPAFDFNGRPETVIDMACFPGSSGSPVVIYETWYRDRKGNINMGLRQILLGILYAGPRVTEKGVIITESIPTATRPVSVTPMMMHLGYVIKAREVLSLGEYIMQTYPDANVEV